MDSAASLIFSTFDTVEGAGRCVERHPVRTVRRLTSALAEANEALGRAPEEQNGDAPDLMELAAERCQAVATYLPIAVNESSPRRWMCWQVWPPASSCRSARPTPGRASS